MTVGLATTTTMIPYPDGEITSEDQPGAMSTDKKSSFAVMSRVPMHADTRTFRCPDPNHTNELGPERDAQAVLLMRKSSFGSRNEKVAMALATSRRLSYAEAPALDRLPHRSPPLAPHPACHLLLPNHKSSTLPPSIKKS
jgi:hypothetical protein